MNINNKFEKLKDIIKKDKKVLIAFSGGVDSTLLLKVAYDILKKECFALTIDGIMHPHSSLKFAKKQANQIGAIHSILNLRNSEIEGFRENSIERCYICKKQIFSKIKEFASSNKIVTIYDGSNLDDLDDFRPGLKAIDELKVKSPLVEAGFTKSDVRELSKILELETWDMPSYSCLATRIPFNEFITDEKLDQIEKSEEYLKSLGFKIFRVRHHDDIARIEFGENEFKKTFDKNVMLNISKTLKSFGFKFVTMDLEGYQTGSLNP